MKFGSKDTRTMFRFTPLSLIRTGSFPLAGQSQSRGCCILTDSKYLYYDPFPALAIEFRIEDPLPRTEIKAAARNRKSRLMMKQERFKMGIAVVLTGPVVFVIWPRGSQFLEPFADILNQTAFQIVDVNSSCNMHR